MLDNLGVFIVGAFEGTQDVGTKYPKVLVRTSEKRQERIAFTPFSPWTGERMITDDIGEGEFVCCHVQASAESYRATDARPAGQYVQWTLVEMVPLSKVTGNMGAPHVED